MASLLTEWKAAYQHPSLPLLPIPLPPDKLGRREGYPCWCCLKKLTIEDQNSFSKDTPCIPYSKLSYHFHNNKIDILLTWPIPSHFALQQLFEVLI